MLVIYTKIGAEYDKHKAELLKKVLSHPTIEAANIIQQMASEGFLSNAEVQEVTNKLMGLSVDDSPYVDACGASVDHSGISKESPTYFYNIGDPMR